MKRSEHVDQSKPAIYVCCSAGWRQTNTTEITMSAIKLCVLVGMVYLGVGALGGVAEEQCHTFAGGAVYPNTEGRASGHNLQWTKAMSRFFIHARLLLNM